MAIEYTLQEASAKATAFCTENAGWIKVCDMPETFNPYKSWKELTAKARKHWGTIEVWRDCATEEPKYPYGFISGAGEFFGSVLDVPPHHQHMMVWKVKTEYKPYALMGRGGKSGATKVHAVEAPSSNVNNFNVSLCGAMPGPTSLGWHMMTIDINCEKCIRKIARLPPSDPFLSKFETKE